MQRDELKRLGVDELWGLHLKVAEMLNEKLAAKKKLIEGRIRLLDRKYLGTEPPPGEGRRPYPPVLPKFRNPNEPFETWAGRGKKPRWLTRQLKAGRRLDDFRIRGQAAE